MVDYRPDYLFAIHQPCCSHMAQHYTNSNWMDAGLRYDDHIFDNFQFDRGSDGSEQNPVAEGTHRQCLQPGACLAGCYDNRDTG